MPLYRKVNKHASSKATKRSKRDISPDLFSSTQASECSNSSNNSFYKKIVKSPKGFKAPSVVGFKKPVLDFIDDGGIIIAATPEKDSNASPQESASFDRGNVDRHDNDFLGERNDTIEIEQLNDEPKVTIKKDFKVDRKPTNKEKNSKKKDRADKNDKISKDKFNKKNFEIVKKGQNKIIKSGEDITPKVNKKSINLKKREQTQKLNQSHENNSQNHQSSQGSQNASQQLYVEALKHRIAAASQEYIREPPDGPSVTQRDRLEWFQRERDVGLYVHCDAIGCDKLRYLADVKDPLDLDDKWYCKLNPDPKYNECTKPEQSFNLFVLADLIENKFNAGSVVWARLIGYPWWPAMVDDCPDTEAYYWLDDDSCTIPSWYNVTFFDEKQVTRAWVKDVDIRPFEKDMRCFDITPPTAMKRMYGARLSFAKNKAIEACKLPLLERLMQFSFLTRYKGKIRQPVDKLDEKNYSKSKKIIDKSKITKQLHNASNALESDESDSEAESFSFKGRKINKDKNPKNKNNASKKTNENEHKNKNRTNKKCNKFPNDDDTDLNSEISIGGIEMVKLSDFLELKKKVLKRKSTSSLTKSKSTKKFEKKFKSIGHLKNRNIQCNEEDEDNISPISGCSNLSVDNSFFD